MTTSTLPRRRPSPALVVASALAALWVALTIAGALLHAGCAATTEPCTPNGAPSVACQPANPAPPEHRR